MAAVPSYLPQTAQAAEHLGMVLVFRYLQARSNVIGDCKGVVDAMHASVASMLSPARRYAGLLMDVFRNPDARRLADTIRWVKAHRTEHEGMRGDEVLDVVGNNAADAAAREAVKLHPPIGEEAAAAVEFYEQRAWLVAKALAVALPLFPPAPGTMTRRRAAAGEVPRATGARLHQWRHDEGAWRCRVCSTWCMGAKVPGAREYERCTGPRSDEKQLRVLGHRPCRAQGAVPFTFCSKCGGWAARRGAKLSRPCLPPTSAGIQALRRIEKGLHPWRRKLQGGREAPRTGVQVAYASAPDATSWLDVRRAEGKAPLVRGERARGPRLEQQPAAVDVRLATSAGGGEVEELPPEFMQWEAEEEREWEDVFGFGGGLDQHQDDVSARCGEDHAKRRRTTVGDFPYERRRSGSGICGSSVGIGSGSGGCSYWYSGCCEPLGSCARAARCPRPQARRSQRACAGRRHAGHHVQKGTWEGTSLRSRLVGHFQLHHGHDGHRQRARHRGRAHARL